MAVTDVASSLPALDLRDGAIITVSTLTAGATITQLVLHVWQETPLEPLPLLPPLLAVSSGEAV